jgi:hypothetical protein
MNFFKDLRDLGMYNDSDPVHCDCIRFCFMHILREELHQVAELWNQHIISSSKFANSSCTEDYKVHVDPHEIDEFVDHSTMSVPDFSDNFKHFASTVIDDLGLQTPTNVKEGLDLYIKLIREVETFT